MEARRKARSMKRSASMGRGASRSAARGKAKARAMGRAKRGGEIVPGYEPKPGDCVKHGSFGTAGKFLFIKPSDGFGAPQVVYEKNGERYHGNASEFSKCTFRGGEKRKKSLKKHHKRRAKRGGDDDIEMGLDEQYKQDIDAMEQGMSPSPPTNYNPPPPSLSSMEKGLAPKKLSTTIETEKKGGKRRKRRKNRSKKAGFGEEIPGKNLKVNNYVRVYTGKQGQNFKNPSTWEPDYIITRLNSSTATVCKLDSEGVCLDDISLDRIKNRGTVGSAVNTARQTSWQYGITSPPPPSRGGKKFYKGKASKTRKGRKDFVTHKGDKYFNRKGHRQTKRQGKSKSLFDQLFGL